MYYHKKYGAVAPEKKYVSSPGFLLRRARILEIIKTLKPGKALEIGCGAGGILCDLASLNFSCTAVETSKSARELAAYLTDGLGFKISIIEDIEICTDQQFSYIFSFVH